MDNSEYPVEKLDNLTVDDIVRKTNNEEVITAETVPFHNVRNNLKMFLIYYAKNQIARVIKLTNYLQILEDRVMNQVRVSRNADPDLILRVIMSIQDSVDSAIHLIDKISTNDNYISLIYNDNRQQLIDNSRNLISNKVEISKDSREKLRRIAENLMVSLEAGDQNPAK